MDQAALLGPAWHWLLGFALAVARPAAMLAVHPLLTRAQLTGLLRGAVAAALALPAVPHMAAEVAASRVGGFGLLLAIVKEALLGFALGLPLGLPFWALDVAGDVLDQQRGATQGRLNDPAGFEDVSITGTLLLISGIALFVTTGGLEVLARLLFASWVVWPPFAMLPSPTAQAPALVLGLLDAILRQGLLLAAPVLLAMLLADVALILMGRFAPQMRLDDVGLAVRNLAFYIVVPLYCAFLISYVRTDQGGLANALDRIRAALPGTAQGASP